MTGRDRDEEHRASTPLELLFDLCFVVAVAGAAAELHHALAEGHFGQGLLGYTMVFFAIWWAWMNFTWFASAYDTDDVLHRLLTLVQMGGALVLAAGVPAAFNDSDFTVVTVGYLVMRVPMVLHWLRARHDHLAARSVATAYAVGIGLVQLLWMSRLLLPQSLGLVTFVLFVGAELAVPIVAERRGEVTRGTMTPWHPGHIAERHGLFTIIVLGEVILASTTAIRDAVTETGLSVALVLVAVGALLLLFSMWWLYFKASAAGVLRLSLNTFAWSYGHIFIFASVAAVGSGIAAMADVVQHHAHASGRAVGLALGVAVATYVVVLALVHAHQFGGRRSLVRGSTTAALVLAIAAVGLPSGATVLLMGVALATTVALHVWQDQPAAPVPL